MLPKFLTKERRLSLKLPQSYSRIDAVDDSDEDFQPSLKPTSILHRLWKPVFILYSIFSSSLIIFLVIKYYTSWPSNGDYQSQTAIQIAPCGNTSTSALAAGCHFDIISFSWLPTQCYDAELADEFEGLTDWAYYLDRNKTQPISQELALTGEFAGLFTEFEYHLRHCTYLWKKMHRALLGDGKIAIDSVTGGYAHTEHCSHMLMTRREVNLDVVNAVIMVKFPDCGIA